ncbi:MAG: hypothetical protein PHP23_10110 [Desulfobacterales bacterium]|nr:hypothetical protein [Desulfobacterales bacterium]MDD4072661.1 hypothetical protein [Desulfobacterales bacterium]MDD4391770.1 hypothetical protein [Desulfobacterales bacterium]
MTGVDLAEKVMSIRPDIPVILYTGYSDRLIQQTALKAGIKKILLKLFVIREIGGAVRETLDAVKRKS